MFWFKKKKPFPGSARLVACMALLTEFVGMITSAMEDVGKEVAGNSKAVDAKRQEFESFAQAKNLENRFLLSLADRGGKLRDALQTIMGASVQEQSEQRATGSWEKQEQEPTVL